jgi:hypothetical protein
MNRKIDAMHQEYGIDKQGRMCKGCVNYSSYIWRSRTVRKCLAYGDTRSESTDWKASYIGCGLYGKLFEGTGRRTMIEVLKAAPRVNTGTEQLDGQIGFEV